MKYAIERIKVGKGEYKFHVWIDNANLKDKTKPMTCGWIRKIGADEYNSSIHDKDSIGVIYTTLKQADKAVRANILYELELDGMGGDWEQVGSWLDF